MGVQNEFRNMLLQMRELDQKCSQDINEYACHHHRESAEQIAEVIRDLISQVRLVHF